MKKSFLYLNIILFSVIVVLSVDCNNNNPEPSIPTYSFVDPIVSPPDSFQIVYNISTYGDRLAYITFEEDAVWYIEKLGDSRINFWGNNDVESIEIVTTDTLGLKAGFTYIFAANNNNYTEYTNLFVQFNKLSLDYEIFEPKF